jgi:hypothetical protein
MIQYALGIQRQPSEEDNKRIQNVTDSTQKECKVICRQTRPHPPQNKELSTSTATDTAHGLNIHLVISYLTEFLAAPGIDGGLEFTSIHFMGCPSSCRLWYTSTAFTASLCSWYTTSAVPGLTKRDVTNGPMSSKSSWKHVRINFMYY